MKWFVIGQNNTGGRFRGPMSVLVLARDQADAWSKARNTGWVPDGGCDCCGPRWAADYVTEAANFAAAVTASKSRFARTREPGFGVVAYWILY